MLRPRGHLACTAQHSTACSTHVTVPAALPATIPWQQQIPRLLPSPPPPLHPSPASSFAASTLPLPCLHLAARAGRLACSPPSTLDRIPTDPVVKLASGSQP